MKKKIFALLALVMTVMTASAQSGEFTISVGNSEHGTIAFKKNGNAVESANEGDVVTVEITPATGWVVNKPSGQWYAAVVRAPRHRASIDLLSDVELTAVTGKENTWTFTMARANVEISATYKKLLTHEDIGISGIKDLTYNGQAQTPAVTVTDGEYTLVPGTDYTISYSDNTNAGEATATLKGTGDNYAGEWVMNFTIKKAALTVKAEDKSVTFGDDAPTYTESYNGFVNNETKAVLSGTLAFACDYVKNESVAGEYDIVPSGLTSANYDITFTKGTLTVGKKALESSMIAAIDPLTYTGKALTPEPVVTFNGMTLVKGTDYTVSYADNVNPGTATVTVTAVASSKKYAGTATKTFTIQKKEVTADMIAAISPLTYTGKAHKPAPVVTYNGMTLKEGTDYIVFYTNNVHAGIATVTIQGIGYYSGTASKLFLIIPKQLENGMIAAIAPVIYTGTQQKPAPVVTYNGMTLVEGLDYTVSYTDNVEAGTATVTVTAVVGGNYSGTASTTFTIQKKSMFDDMIATINPVTYTGQPLTPDISVTYNGMNLVLGRDYTVSYSDNVNAGYATVTIQGYGNYRSTASKQFYIAPKLLSELMVSDIDNQVYTGEALTPAPVITYNGMTLVEGTDYTVSYTDNVDTGTATVTITAVANGNYRGTVTTSFTIVADKTELNSVITDADAFYGSIKDNYADIAATLLEAIDEAKGVQGDENASQQAVNDAVDALKGAIQAAKDAIATGIAAIQMDAKSVWYDLNGRKLQGKPTRKGLYIVNGRTVVVK